MTRLLCVAAAVLACALAAFQPPEEEERPPAKPAPAAPTSPTKPADPAPDPAPAKPEGAAQEAPSQTATRLPDLAREASSQTSPKVKAFLKRYEVAHDVVTDRRGRTLRVNPVPLVWGKDKFPAEFGAVPLDEENRPQEVVALKLAGVQSIEHFEQNVLFDLANLLKDESPGLPGRAARLALAEKVLSEVYLFHGSARESNRRRGKSWDAVQNALAERLVAARLERLKLFADAKDFAQLASNSKRYLELYQSQAGIAEQVVTLRLAEAEQLVKSDNPVDLERARNLLGEYESRFPQGGAPAALAVRKVLADKARALIAEAQRLSETDRNAARNLLNTAEALDPESEKLRTARSELRAGYPTLVVAARQRPELMSPALARFDSERQAVELMFEPLLDAVPDEVAGQRYEPQLAASLPGAGAGLREIQLAGPANWNLDGAGAVRAADVSGTARLLRQIPGTWSADRLQWLADPGTDPADPTRLRQRLTLGHPDPRSLLSGKILPASWLLARIRRADDPDFARKPFGSGPYRLLAETPKPGAPPPSTSDVVFVANPSYARRPGKANTPRIREVRFTPLEALKDPPGEFRAGKLHVLTDVPTRELVRYAADNNLNNKVRLVTAADPRRVHVLMVNHRNPALQNPDIRRGIALAVNREKIVDTVFRSADRPEVRHAAMTGPFPPGSWATPKGRPALDQRELGAAKIRGYLAAGGSVNSLTLLYPAGDLEADLACSSIRDQIQPLTAADERKFTLTIQPVSPAELFQRVHVEHRYELAYCPLDYSHSFAPLTLMSLLDPSAAGPLGRNALGYLGPNTTPTDADLRLGQTLSELRKHRDFTGRLVPLAEKLHQQFNDAMPFIPLWQLDRHMILARGVQVSFPGQPEAADPRRLDFTRLFQGVEQWRVE